MGDLSDAIDSPDSIAMKVYSAKIISWEKRDEIFDNQQSLNKKLALLRAVEAQIRFRSDVYYEFLEILSKNPAMDFICQKMREECGKSGQLHVITSSLPN